MDRRTTTTRRKGDPREPAPVESRPAPVEGRPAAEPAPPAAAQTTPSPRLDADDLRALADMDRSELAALMDGMTRRVRLAEGDRVEGPVTRIGKEYVFVDVGSKSEASIARAEAPDARVGENLVAYVLSTSEDGVVLGRHLSGAAADGFLETAKASGIPVDGKVTARNTGGFDVQLGTIRAFCPVSQIDRHPGEDLDAWVGRTLRFKVVTVGAEERGRRDVVVSRRAVQEAEIEEARAAFWASVRVGDVHQGTVSGSKPFGVFVDLGPAEGLVPRSEVEGRDPLVAGAAIEVRITAADRDQRRLTLQPTAKATPKVEGPGDTGSLGTFGDLFKGWSPGRG